MIYSLHGAWEVVQLTGDSCICPGSFLFFVLENPMKKRLRKRTDSDFVALDEAIAVIEDWFQELADELAKRGIRESNLSTTLEAMREVHSPSPQEEDDTR